MENTYYEITLFNQGSYRGIYSPINYMETYFNPDNCSLIRVIKTEVPNEKAWKIRKSWTRVIFSIGIGGNSIETSIEELEHLEKVGALKIHRK